MLISDRIDMFAGDYAFLSNFYPSRLRLPWDDRWYPTAEHAYQACKTNIEAEKDHILDCFSAGKAKREGRKVTIRDDWELCKVDFMTITVQMKFFQNDDLMDKLLNTAGTYLEEGNDWGDTYWGTVNGKGLNVLGNILMKVRDDFLEDIATTIMAGTPK